MHASMTHMTRPWARGTHGRGRLLVPREFWRVAVYLNELIGTLARDARHAENACELVHVERRPTHALHWEESAVDLGAH